MKAFLLVLAIAAVGAFYYPTLHEQTDDVCGALEKRAGEVANASMQGPYASAATQAKLNGLIHDSSGGIATAAIGAALPGVPPSVGCALGYWRLMMNPNLNQMLASVH
jgi:hypothetical protein